VIRPLNSHHLIDHIRKIMRSFENKVAVVTGAASGVGQALAVQLAEMGTRVAIADINDDNLDKTAEAIRAKGGKVSRHTVDVSSRTSVHDFSDAVVKQHGAVDIVINNAGVALSKVTIEHLAYEEFEWVMGVNLWGVVYGTKAFLPHLLKRPEANIVNISSTLGLTSAATAAAYSTSKFAVRGFTEALRQELRKTPVTVTLVFPGGIRTNVVRNVRRAVGSSAEEKSEIASQRFESRAQTTPDNAARRIITGIKRNQPRVLIGRDARFLDLLARFRPVSYDRFMLKRVLRETD
jgi:NAD(P)-dependent dehydrogenase (short-subunit alcohol dehydrogenase family)